MLPTVRQESEVRCVLKILWSINSEDQNHSGQIKLRVCRLATDQKLGCTTGSGELGAMGPSKHDSIDNTDSFYGQPVKNRSDDS